MVPFDRTRQVVLGTTIEGLEHIPRLIDIGFIRIGCLLHLCTSSTIHPAILQIRTLFSNFSHVFPTFFVLFFILKNNKSTFTLFLSVNAVNFLYDYLNRSL